MQLPVDRAGTGTWPRTTSSRLMPRSSRPTLSPACPSFSCFLNISTPAPTLYNFTAPCRGDTQHARRVSQRPSVNLPAHSSSPSPRYRQGKTGNLHVHSGTWRSDARQHPGSDTKQHKPRPRSSAFAARSARRPSVVMCQRWQLRTCDGGLDGVLDAQDLHLLPSFHDALLHTPCHHRPSPLQSKQSVLSWPGLSTWC